MGRLVWFGIGSLSKYAAVAALGSLVAAGYYVGRETASPKPRRKKRSSR